jgi:RHS repeat-associated protein
MATSTPCATASWPLTVTFTNESTPLLAIEDYEWAFGDGATSVITHPTHVYTATGVYTVSLTAEGPGGSDTLTRTNYVTVTGVVSPPVAGFTAAPLSGNAPLTVTFTNTTTGEATGYEWVYGDGATSVITHPTHIYTATGVYTVSLTATGPGGSDTLTRTNYITVTGGGPEPPVAGFTASPLSGDVPLTVTFTNTTTGEATGYEWVYGDGLTSTTSTVTHTHAYTATGIYTVSLTATGPGGSDTLTRTNYITVTEVVSPPVAGFTAAPLSGDVPLTVTFTNTTTGEATGYEWVYGDGLTGTTSAVTHTHAYTATGIYTVSLTATGPGGNDTLTRTNYITVTSAGPGELVTTTITYVYDPLYRLTSAVYSGTLTNTYAYAYDAAGNRTAMTDTAGTHSYTYDDANRLTSVDSVTYTWDDNGNLRNNGVFTFTYDSANRLITVTNGTTLTLGYRYNGDGGRVAKTVGGTETRYTLDPAAGLVQVLVETTGGQSTVYLYGHDLLGEEEGTAWAWHLGDGLGSVRQLTDGDGDVTLAQGYTPFGVLLWSEGSGASAYGFTGEQEDPSAGLVFLRARYYDPATGRFISKDPFPGVTQRPQTLHKFVYVLNNAVNHTDPTGQLSPEIIEESFEGLSIDELFEFFDRWGLYALLLDAEFGDTFSARYLDFDYEGEYWPLAPAPSGKWTIVQGECGRLEFLDAYGKQLSLKGFFERLLVEAEGIPYKIWRRRTSELHWYVLRNSKFYNDFKYTTEVPDVIMKGAGAEKEFSWPEGNIRIGIGVDVFMVYDCYGNKYISLSAGIGIGVSAFEYWEGYAFLPRGIDYSHMNESWLRDIIEGASISFSIQVGAGVGIDFWKSGGLDLFGVNPAIGVEESLGHTFYIDKSGRPWLWIDADVQGYDSSVRHGASTH